MRITPAHAGNTLDEATKPCYVKDHPRACGEHRVYKGRCINLLGSPPRMRGTQHNADKWRKHRGITPAHAGNT